jgi:hypothetical protein
MMAHVERKHFLFLLFLSFQKCIKWHRKHTSCVIWDHKINLWCISYDMPTVG